MKKNVFLLLFSLMILFPLSAGIAGESWYNFQITPGILSILALMVTSRMLMIIEILPLHLFY